MVGLLKNSSPFSQACFNQKKVFSALAFLAALMIAEPGFASSEVTEDVISYDTIVEQLNREANAPAPSMRIRRGSYSQTKDPFESVWIHFGVGMTGNMQSVTMNNGRDVLLNQRGVQAALGIDLFSPNLMAETTARSFGETTERETTVSLNEFDLKLIYKNRFSRQLSYKMGAGLTARYLNLSYLGQPTMSFTTPSSLAVLGMDLFFTDRISIGTDLSIRSAMIGETLDRVSYDATLRMDTHF